MSDKIRDAFLRGKSVAQEREKRALEESGADRHNLETLWKELQRYSDIIRGSGFIVGDIQYWWIPIGRAKYSGSSNVSWQRGVCTGQARDESGNYVFEFGATPREAAEKILFFMGLNTLIFSED